MEHAYHEYALTQRDAFSPHDRARLNALCERIHPSMHGCYKALAEHGPQGLALVGIRIDPDPALEAMRALMQKAGKHSFYIAHRNAQINEKLNLTGERFDALLNDAHHHAAFTKPFMNPAKAKDADYVGTYPLDLLLTQANLDADDCAGLQKAADAIPANMRGMFLADAVKEHDTLRITWFGLNPDVTLAQLDEGMQGAGTQAGLYRFRHPSIRMSLTAGDLHHLAGIDPARDTYLRA